MADSWLTQLMKNMIKAQSSDEVIKREVIREVIYKEADWLSLAAEAITVKTFDGIDVKFSYPTEMSGQYPVAENAATDITPPMEAVDFEMTLQQGEVRYYVTDQAKLRQLGNYQTEFSRRRAAEKLAELKNKNIIDGLYTGAGATAIAATAKKWDAYPTTTGQEIASHIVQAIGSIMQESNCQVHELKNLVMLVPAEVWGVLQAPIEIENIRESLQNYFGRQYGMKIFPTRYTHATLETHLDALVYLNNENTAIHGVLQAGAPIPLVEETRKAGRGTEYLIRQFFNTKVVPHSAALATSKRICKITDVRAV
jgi:hypothetical protein